MKNAILIIGCSTLLLLFATTLNGQVAESNAYLKDKINTYLSEGVENGFSGAILIAKEGKIIINKGYGPANQEENIPYTANTVATIGSVTKQFTATAILKLQALNKLKVTDPLAIFFKNIPSDKKQITIHQLLTHSSGLIDVIGEGDFDDIPRERFFKTIFATQLLHPPGSKYRYSNAGYSILARIIELVSDQEYEQFLHENLFKPAGMKHTGYFIPEWKGQLIASGYIHSFIGVGTMLDRYQQLGKVTWTLKGNGGIHSTPGDMYKWYKALQSNKILSASMFELLTTPHVPENEKATSHYGYGWAIYNSIRNTKIISHNGGNGIFFHDFIWFPTEDVLVILFTNAGSRETEVAWPIAKMIFEESYQAAPIKKNLHLLVFDFMKNNRIPQANELFSMIKEDYKTALQNSDYLNGLGYDLLRYEAPDAPDHIAWAVAIFKFNTELFPTDGNCWDSLGEGYLKNGQREEARKNYQQALELGAGNECSWCKSSKSALKKLGKMK